MTKHVKKYISILLVCAFCTLMLTGCGGGGSNGSPQAQKDAVLSLLNSVRVSNGLNSLVEWQIPVWTIIEETLLLISSKLNTTMPDLQQFKEDIVLPSMQIHAYRQELLISRARMSPIKMEI